MTKQDVTDIADAFAKGTEATREAKGFGGVQFHGAHGYLVCCGKARIFAMMNMAAYWKTARLSQSRLSRSALPSAKTSSHRLSQWKQQDFEHKMATDPDKLKAFLQPMVDAGIDCFDCSTRRFWEPKFEGSDLNFAGWTKKLMGLPSITVGSVGLTGEFVAGMGGNSEAAPIDGLIERPEREEFDLVGVGRALLTDAE